jgi:hypothetical protein
MPVTRTRTSSSRAKVATSSTPATSASDPSRHSSSERVIARFWAERAATVALMLAGGRLETKANGAGGLVSASG